MYYSKNKIRNYLRFIIVFTLAIYTSSCNKFLAITPTNAVSDQIAITDSASASNALRGNYRTLADGLSSFYFDVLLSGNDILYTQSSAYSLQFLYHTLTSDNDDLGTIWANEYAVINQANFILSKVPDLQNISDKYKSQILGEAYFLRGIAYFNLARTFGNVQLFLKPTLEVSDKYGVSQSPKDEVLNQVLNDLNDAISLLPDVLNRNRATKKSAIALRSRLFLYLDNWDAAEKDASSVISDSSNYKLVYPYSLFYTSSDNSEIIFEASYSLNYPNGMYSGWKSGGNYRPNDSIISLLNDPEVGGSRKSLLTKSGNTILGNLYPSSNGTDPIPLIRVAELFLIRAEARAHLGNYVGAFSDLNKVRSRADLPNIAVSNNSIIYDYLEKEGRVEFALEPYRWFNLVRTGRAASVLNVSEAFRYLFPIPTSEIQADKSLIQNPGYSSSN
ncbi:SusD family protein [Arachidicoccus rhizosphaerae]|uniref:SusD family protein n=1 Tax=Arachidicoccus rhizosphaerae TaxID=551991 RepID=A0A1H3XU75_9BACT|nr:RagB/SusD family nutrient uptake outer membrane protein [Arachidicoccus rhizosphaerae]SEA02421.1 SusD family protein [Arachidicoccus rhizosphaerae]